MGWGRNLESDLDILVLRCLLENIQEQVSS